MRLMPADIILMSGETGVTLARVLGEFRLLKLNRFLRFCLEFRVELVFFLRQTLLQYRSNLTGKLVESAIAFA